MYHSKFERDHADIIKHFINKQLEPFGKNYDWALATPNWFSRFKITEQQNREWIDYCIDYLRKNYRMPKYRAKKEMLWFNMMWGLSIK